jgi:hypothetical protein
MGEARFAGIQSAEGTEGVRGGDEGVGGWGGGRHLAFHDAGRSFSVSCTESGG